MNPRLITLDSLAAVLPREGRVLVQGCSAESELLADAVIEAGDALGALTFTGVFVPGLNRKTYLANSRCRVETFFLTPELSKAGAAVELLPFCYRDISRWLRTAPIVAALMTVSPPNSEGLCSFGPTVDFLAELWPRIPIRIAQINPALPRTHGPCAIPFEQLTAVVEGDTSPLGLAQGGVDSASDMIAARVAAYIEDGATLQMGLGRLPGAILQGLHDRRGLRIHSGLIGDGVLGLLDAGALSAAQPIVGGVAIGTPSLYTAITDEAFRFEPSSYTHNAQVLSRITGLVTVNSAVSIDLYGQAYSERTLRGFASGPGGATDFAHGAGAAGGLRIVTLPASTAQGATGRIIAPQDGSGPVSLGRFDIDIVVTEYGAADLRGCSLDGRAEALAAIAAPQHRAALSSSWRELRRNP